MYTVIEVLAIIALLLGIWALGRYLYNAYGRPKYKLELGWHLPSNKYFWRGVLAFLSLLLISLLALLAGGIITSLQPPQDNGLPTRRLNVEQPFSKQEVTEATVRDAVGNIIDYPITYLEVVPYGDTPDFSDVRIHIEYNSSRSTSTYHPLPHFFTSSSQDTAMAVWKVLFQNDHIAVATISCAKDIIVDEYGNRGTQLVSRYTMRKEVADKIVDWSVAEQNFSKLAEIEYPHP
ncbi:hypothetical protein ACFLVH_06030 [Chloroflexota bacterium]